MEKLLGYSKFKLKPEDEIKEALKGKNNFYIFSCKKCFIEFKDFKDEELEKLKQIIEGKHIVETSSIDFLCNTSYLQKIISEHQNQIEKSDMVLILACGIGAQTLSAQIKKPFYIATDSIYYEGYHGVSLFEEKCRACGNCYLNITSGICPIVNCTKGLLNGPCGGAKDGKCETDPEKDCGWIKIYESLKLKGNLDTIKNYYPPLDNSLLTPKKILTYHEKIKAKREEGFYGGIYPEEKKYTRDSPIEPWPEPKIVVLPLIQHIGAECKSLVKVGDSVKVGQKIADSTEKVSAPIHSPVSGKVIAIEPRYHPIKKTEVLSIIIESDGEGKLHENIYPKDKDLDPKKIVSIIREAGIVGLGGATFPTHVKLSPTKKIDTLILNGCECEPRLTCDERLMIERPEEIITGMKFMMTALGVKNGYFAIEDNKQEAIETISKIIEKGIEIKILKTKYPQGAERMLVKRILNRNVPPGGFPMDVGVIVQNVSTAYAVYEAIVKGMPLIKRVVTVNGDSLKYGRNYEVILGTSAEELVKSCGLKDNGDYEIKVGGPMMGITQENLDFPVIKATTGIIVDPPRDIEYKVDNECIKCGRCVSACPMELYPLYFPYFWKLKNLEEMKRWGLFDCFECGCCEYVCSSKIPIIEIVKKAKLGYVNS